MPSILFALLLFGISTSDAQRMAVRPAATDEPVGALSPRVTRAAAQLQSCAFSTGRWGDVTDDGSVNIIDAQQVARFTIGLTAAIRINAILVPLPTVRTVVITPATASLTIGSTRTLIVEPRDSLERSLLP
jgi:hypothetical protein